MSKTEMRLAFCLNKSSAMGVLSLLEHCTACGSGCDGCEGKKSWTSELNYTAAQCST